MPVKKFIDSNGELSVEQSFNLPLSKIEYLQHLPTLIVVLGICGMLLFLCLLFLANIDHNLAIIMKEGLK